MFSVYFNIFASCSSNWSLKDIYNFTFRYSDNLGEAKDFGIKKGAVGGGSYGPSIPYNLLHVCISFLVWCQIGA